MAIERSSIDCLGLWPYRWSLGSYPLGKRIALLGNGKIASLIQELLKGGYLVDYPTRLATEEIDLSYGEGLVEWARQNRIGKVIVAFSDARGQLPTLSLLGLKVRGIEVVDGVTFVEQAMGKIPIDSLRPSTLVFSEGFKRPFWIRPLKRLLDILFTSIGLVISLPLSLIVAILIKLESKGPIFYIQERIGENGKVFRLIKFRSMKADAEAQTGPVWAEEKDPRTTKVGAILRFLRIDEIPQMINVLMGEMSFVGPRPERPPFVEMLRKKIPYYDLRLSIKPGITGWAQIKYQYGSSKEDAAEKLQYDLYYIKHLSLLFDLSILFETVHVVLTGKGSR